MMIRPSFLSPSYDHLGRRRTDRIQFVLHSPDGVSTAIEELSSAALFDKRVTVEEFQPANWVNKTPELTWG